VARYDFTPGAEARDAFVAWRWHVDPLSALSQGLMAGAWAREQLQVPEAGGEPPPGRSEGFAVALAVSGGMDSTTLWAMATEADLPALPYYVDVGQEYAQAELTVLRGLIGREPTVITVRPPIRARFGHIIPGRNATIVFSVADALRTLGRWGEIWLGNLAGESPPVGGDKSARFLSTTQQLLTLLGYDVNLCSPLGALDKPDLVRWWTARGRLEELARTKSCFHPTLRACGSCQACFRRLVAFHAAGAVEVLDWDGPVDFAAHIARYRAAMGRALEEGDFSHYSRRRCLDTLACIEDMEAARAA
jgi:7-cyano-7-deazaguanine synthase in queuosine biosynthesis